jgi:succinoglycan biosynthesis protein ExoV
MMAEASCLNSLDVALEGQVVAGRGLAAPELVTLREQVQAIVKEPLCPGSLNVVLNHPLRLLDTAGFSFDGDYRTLWRASLDGINVWVYRWRESPLHIIEVLSSVYLRERLKLKDGDTIKLRMSKAQIGKIRFQEWFIWAALWTGRRRWFYSCKLYSNRTVRLGKNLGATQEQALVRGPIPISVYVMKEMVTLVPTVALKDLAQNLLSASKRVVKSTPVIGALADNLKQKYSRKYPFSRIDTENCADAGERVSHAFAQTPIAPVAARSPSMKVHLAAQVHGNFGDELNRWLWSGLLPHVWSNADNDVLFVGIGTVLDRNLPRARLTIVFGTGTGYTSAPADIATHPSRWRIYGVRGPLTARALNLDIRTAMTDPAILLATLREFTGLDRHGVIFIPHWKSVRYGDWQGICKTLGIEYVDPCQDSKLVVRRIAAAEKVIAESMHAAIIADAFRVPWIPVALSREISPFKWVDWASSLDVAYRPVCLPPSNGIERIRNAMLTWTVHCNATDYPSSDQVAQGACMDFEDVDRLLSNFDEIGRRINQRWRRTASIGLEAALKRVARLGLGSDERMLSVATERMGKLKSGEGFLSSDQAHARVLDDTLCRLEDFRRDANSGVFS